MSDKRKYVTGAALRAALEERFKQIAKTEGTELQRLRRQVAFDRFLARLFGGADIQWVLKGGYAMELRFQIARATKDLDFTVRTISAPAGDAVLEYLQEAGQRMGSTLRGFLVLAVVVNQHPLSHPAARAGVASASRGGPPISWSAAKVCTERSEGRLGIGHVRAKGGAH